MEIRKLSADDIDLLVKLRIDFLSDGKSEFSRRELESLRSICRDFFYSAYRADNFIAFAAEEEGETISAAFLVLSERPPRKPFTPCLAGTVYNVYTYKKHRKRGAAARVIAALLDEARGRGAASVDLLASDDGVRLYEKAGFRTIDHAPMRKILFETEESYVEARTYAPRVGRDQPGGDTALSEGPRTDRVHRARDDARASRSGRV